MKIKDMALVGMGMGAMYALLEYGMPTMKKVIKSVSKSMDKIGCKIDQMM